MDNNIYEMLAKEIGSLVDQKNKAYGSSFAESYKIIQILYPNGVKIEQYTDFLATIRLIDKLFRIANKKEAFGESPWNDIAGYALLAVQNDRNKQKSEKEKQETAAKDYRIIEK